MLPKDNAWLVVPRTGIFARRRYCTKGVIENLASVLTAIFTPLFAVMLLVSAVVYAVAGIGCDFDRNLLTVFDVLLLVVLGLVLYGISARESSREQGRWKSSGWS